MNIDLQHRKILELWYVRFSILLLCLQNDVKFWGLYLFSLSVGFVISTRCLDILYVAVPMVDTIFLIRQSFSSLWDFTVPHNFGGIGSDGYIWKCYLSVNFLSFPSQNHIFWILLVSLDAGSFFAIFALPSCSSFSCVAFFSDNTANLGSKSNGYILVFCCYLFALTPFIVMLKDCLKGLYINFLLRMWLFDCYC